MLKKIIGLILLLHPLYVPVLLFVYRVEFFWYWSDNYNIYDFIYACFGFGLFVIGIILFFKKSRPSIVIGALSIFVVYQTFSMRADIRRYDDYIELPHQRGIALIDHSGGAWATGPGLTNLTLSEPRFFIFRQLITIKSYPGSSSAKLNLTDKGLLEIELVTFDKEKITDSLPVGKLVEK